MTNTLVLFKKFLATLMLVGMMTAFVTGCSSSGDSDDAAADESAAPQQGEGCDHALYDPNCDVNINPPECEAANKMLCDEI
jgi:hypothetical protein